MWQERTPYDEDAYDAGDGDAPDGDAPASSGHGPHGHGPDGHGTDGHGPDDHGPDGHGSDGHGPDDHGPDGHGPDGHGSDGHGPDGHGPHPGHGTDGHGPDGPSSGSSGTIGEILPAGVHGGGGHSPVEVIDVEAESVKDEPRHEEGLSTGCGLPVVTPAESGILLAVYILIACNGSRNLRIAEPTCSFF